MIAPELLFGYGPSGDSGAARSGVPAGELFASSSWSSSEPVDRARIEQLMDRVPGEVWRVKGVVRLTDDDRRAWVLQRVGQRWSLRPTSRSADSVARSEIVAIGRPGAAAETWLDTVLG